LLERHSKIATPDRAIAQIADGSTVAIGGLSYYGAPMELVRALIRRKARELTLVTAAVTGIQADFLIAAGCVKKIYTPYVALEELGLAPAFRRAVEKGTIELVEMGEAFLAFGLKAASAGAPFYALPRKLAASDCPKVNPLYRSVADPFTGDTVTCIPAICPDWTLLHVRRSDAFGNLQHEGTPFMDPLLARASRRVIASCDELVDHNFVRAHSAQTTIPGLLVKTVVPSPGAALPTGSFGSYDVDRAEIKAYAKASRNEVEFATYLDRATRTPPAIPAARPQPSVAPDLAATDSAPASRAEIIAVEVSRAVRDGMFTGAGTGCWEVLAGLRLAQLTHAPNLSFSTGGSGALNPRLSSLPASLNGDEALADCEGSIGLEELFDLELSGAFDIMFASGMQIDQHGNINLACIGPWEEPALRGPGTVGLEFACCVPEWVAFFRIHARQTFVPKVDFISAMGYGSGPHSRKDLGVSPKQGPKLVISNLAVMDFCPVTQRMRLKSVHPGCTVEQVIESTGFPLVVGDHIPSTPPPTDSELKLLREEIDRGGLLQNLIP
jgi:acyl CoA:acetate/3-ketoacid CoA transferase alpha subunit/acyl CoA:acetate/3-ketoacid CoA transferase beta subunit